MPGFSFSETMSLEAVSFTALDGFSEDDLLAAFEVFAKSCRAIADHRIPLRAALDPPPVFIEICHRALAFPPRDTRGARQFFETYFEPHRVRVTAKAGDAAGFVTGYYEPVVEGALTPDADFSAPIFARPDDLVTLPQGENLASPDGPLQAAKATPGGLQPYPDRAAIEAGALGNQARPLVWLKDKAEAFFIHVQGSARVKLRDGPEARLTYAGRNGHPYSSIGKILVEEETIAPQQAGMAGLKQWIRDKGQAPGEAGAALMLRNKSFIFFALSDVLSDRDGPVGAQGVSLTPLRSLAVDRSLWFYGLPYWIEAEIPWASSTAQKFRRLMIGQDTGSAIVGAARGDLFFGSGDEAGARAGEIRHPAAFTVFLPRNWTSVNADRAS